MNYADYYAPQIFESLGIASTKTGLFATGIYGVVKMTTCAAFLLLAADSLGRRKSLLWTSIAQGTAMFYVGLYVRIDPPVKGATVPPAGYMALVCICECFLHHPHENPCSHLYSTVNLQSNSPLRSLLPVRMGTLLLDLRLRNPLCAPPIHERRYSSSHPMALQFRRCPRYARHDQH